MRLSDALRVSAGDIVSFVGAGGKSNAIRTLVREQYGRGRVIVTTTTNLGLDQTHLGRLHLVLNADKISENVQLKLSEKGSVLITGPQNEAGTKWTGVSAAELEWIHQIAKSSEALLLVEADGARRRSLKVPAPHEPQIPDVSTHVVPVVGLDVLGTSISGELVHRTELLQEQFHCQADQQVDVDLLTQILASPLAGLRNIPEEAEVRVLLNKVRTTDHWSQADQVARNLLQHRRIQACLFGEVADPETPVDRVCGRVAGVILAAGEARRMGHPKQLLEWRGKPLLWYPIQAAKFAGLSPIVVVLGSSADEIREAFQAEEVTWVDNPNWREGQSSSLLAGLEAVQDCCEAAVFFLADMPLIGRDLVEALIKRHQATLAPIVIPRINGQRANPVLFDRNVFAALASLKGDAGGRQLFDSFLPSFLDWEEPIFADVDTPEDLKRLP